MADEELILVDLAMKKRLLTRKQAEQIRDEVTALGEKAGEVMRRRHYVTDAQLEQLRREAADMPTHSGDTRELRPYPADPEPDPSSHALRPPKISELRAQRSQETTDAELHEESTHRALAAVVPAAAPQAASERIPAPQPATPPPAAPAATVTLPPGRVMQSSDAVPLTEPIGDAAVAAVRKRLAHLLRLARHWGASDLHLSVGRPPFVRMYGQLRYMEEPPLTPIEAEELNFAGLREKQVALARRDLALDFALEIPRIGRHRCNIFHHRLGWDGSYRIVGATVPTLEHLGLPAHLRGFTEYHQGLVMITGPGGSGKTTTAAALLDLVNETRHDHIITVEEPIEYVVAPRNCQVTQREVGRHTQSFAQALRAALREDPDIIFIGEMRDPETTSMAITAAETGHLVFATMNTGSAARTVAKIVDYYPASQQAQVLTMVAESLRGVVSQQLIPRRDARGVAVAVEILVNTTGIAQQIKEGKTHMISSLIQGGKKHGMCLMDDSLMQLLRETVITGREAYRRAANKPAFEQFKDQ